MICLYILFWYSCCNFCHYLLPDVVSQYCKFTHLARLCLCKQVTGGLTASPVLSLLQSYCVPVLSLLVKYPHLQRILLISVTSTKLGKNSTPLWHSIIQRYQHRQCGLLENFVKFASDFGAKFQQVVLKAAEGSCSANFCDTMLPFQQLLNFPHSQQVGPQWRPVMMNGMNQQAMFMSQNMHVPMQQAVQMAPMPNQLFFDGNNFTKHRGPGGPNQWNQLRQQRPSFQQQQYLQNNQRHKNKYVRK